MKYPPVHAPCDHRALSYLFQPCFIHCPCLRNLHFRPLLCCPNSSLSSLSSLSLYSRKLPELHHPHHSLTMSSPLCTQLSLPAPSSLLCSILIVPLLLPVLHLHNLYMSAITSPILFAIEEQDQYKSDVICQELIQLFHGIASTQLLHFQTCPSDVPVQFGLPLCTALSKLPGHVLNLLHFHQFHQYFEALPHETLYPIFKKVYLSMTKGQQDKYLTNTEIPSPSTNSPIPVPQPAPSIPLVDCISSCPASPTPTDIETGHCFHC